MTKTGHQKFWALNGIFFLKRSFENLKIWSANFFPVPPNSAPSFKQNMGCMLRWLRWLCVIRKAPECWIRDYGRRVNV